MLRKLKKHIYILATYLDEANVKRLLTEALTADVQPVFPNQTGLVGADAAVLSH